MKPFTPRLRAAALVATALTSAVGLVLLAPGTAIGAPEFELLARNETSSIETASKGWLVTSYAQVEVASPPVDQRKEREALKAAVTRRTADDVARLRWWSTGGPAYRWNEIIMDELQASFVTMPLAARHLALFHAAVDDAVGIAKQHRKTASDAAKVASDGSELPPATPGSAPSLHAAAAVAASEVLGSLFPDRAASFTAKAEEAIAARLRAGAEYPADVETGRSIGRKVAALAIARGKADRSDTKWTGTVPDGPGLWTGTNPIAPAAATWQTWVLSSGSEFRPPAPPRPGSEQTMAALQELKAFQRTPKSNHRAMFWEVNGGARVHVLWNDLARTKLLESGAQPAKAARVLSTLNIAFNDAAIACWDAKYAYWHARPPQLDPELKPLFPPPNHPSYPAAHGCLSSAAATVLAAAFPSDRDRLLALGKEASEARIWAGIHYRYDIDAGQEIGRKVGERALARSFAARTQ